MPVALSAACAVISENTGCSLHHVKSLARRFQELGEFPRSPGGRLPALITHKHVSMLLLAMLIDRPGVEAARLAAEMGDYTCDSTMAADYISRMLVAAGGADWMAPHSLLAGKASITAHIGDAGAVVVRFSCTDFPLEEAFTSAGTRWQPDHSCSITTARTLPGTLLHRIGRGLSEAALS